MYVYRQTQNRCDWALDFFFDKKAVLALVNDIVLEEGNEKN